ncbi:MAG: alpha/beta fold hydrolase, partial [Desulfatiglandales bacterium]|nr:alpha/beta fold hydrolase [Desulfatiglandales bacterium]
MNEKEVLSQIITMQGGKAHYITAGEPRDLNVVFLHGARFSAEDWISVGSLKLVADWGYGAFALDLPGYGKSDRNSLKPHAFLEEFVKVTGLARFILVGPSMGGQVALQCALKGLKGIVALVLFAPAGLPSLKDQLGRIEQPILLMWGDGDRVISPSHAGILLKETKRTHFVAFPGEGHT